MPKATAADIAKVKAANPGIEIELVEHPSLPHDFIVRGPSRGVWNIYRAKISSEGEKVTADDVLFQACVLWPERGEEREALLDQYPGLVNVVAGEIIEIGGASRQATHRKL
jgi:hypothetical protein